ncbi:MAG: hypothetical protein FJZ98_01660 [Chloroflexi bacterium]|nr:hypothetical protein [Chloroflexota bacterium]
MKELSSSIVYFEKPGKENTDRTLEIALKRVEDLNIQTVVVASTGGFTGELASGLFKSKNLVVVTHAQGYKGPNIQELTEENRKTIISNGGKILTAQHTFGGVNRSVRNKMNTYQLDEIIADVLRIFGAGMKVMMEICMMAADAGLIEVGKPALAIAGTHRGADMAAILIPANSSNFFDLKVSEILCMPSEGHVGF